MDVDANYILLDDEYIYLFSLMFPCCCCDLMTIDHVCWLRYYLVVLCCVDCYVVLSVGRSVVLALALFLFHFPKNEWTNHSWGTFWWMPTSVRPNCASNLPRKIDRSIKIHSSISLPDPSFQQRARTKRSFENKVRERE